MPGQTIFRILQLSHEKARADYIAAIKVERAKDIISKEQYKRSCRAIQHRKDGIVQDRWVEDRIVLQQRIEEMEMEKAALRSARIQRKRLYDLSRQEIEVEKKTILQLKLIMGGRKLK